MNINSQTLKQFQKDLASKNPTPGGGVVAALSAQLAANLIQMVCNLTLDKKGYEKVQSSILKIGKEVSQFEKRLINLAEEDKKAFDKVMAAYRSKSKPTIKKTLKYAIEVPLEVRKIAQNLEKLGYRVSKIGNKNAFSDAKTAIYMAHAASKSALENIKINKESLKNL